MLMFVSIVGLAVAVLVFLNMLNASQPKNRNASFAGAGGNGGGNSGGGNQGENPIPGKKATHGSKAAKILKASAEAGPNVAKPRICPVCGTYLAQSEFLMAALGPEIAGQKRQAQIYGCPHCYRTDGVNVNKNAIIKEIDL